MKLVIVTSVEEYEKDILKLFKTAGIKNFSSTEINGYRNTSDGASSSSWFPSVLGGNDSKMFFSFTLEQEIDELLSLLKEFNNRMQTNNPIRAIVLPIETHI
jgi:hypothetical protein